MQLKLKAVESDLVVKAGSGAGEKTLTANWQGLPPLRRCNPACPSPIQAVENATAGEPSVELEARFKSDASLLVVQNRNTVTSESITLDDNEKSFSMTAPAAMDEGCRGECELPSLQWNPSLIRTARRSPSSGVRQAARGAPTSRSTPRARLPTGSGPRPQTISVTIPRR